MDGGDKERAVANGIKEVVKHTSRRKAAQSVKQRDPAKIAPKSTGLLESPSSLVPSQDRPDAAFSADDTALLMHFLDHVFPLQYPVYKPGIQGGRGWLLSALTQTKPLYHAALSLSAYHRWTVASAMLSRPCQIATLIQQEKHLEASIKSLNSFSHTYCHSGELSIIQTIIQLAFLEVFTNYGNAWKAHLRAATSMYQRNNRYGSAPPGLAVLKEELPLLEFEALVSNEAAQSRFISGTLIWLDIISCITTATTPQLLLLHSAVMAPDSQTRLEDIMGCKNRVMLQIGRIAALHANKLQALRQGHFNCEQFEGTISDISIELQSGFDASEPNPVPLCNPSTLITPVFASMALVYIHLITHGFQQLELLDAVIARVITTLQRETPMHLLPALVAPLYVTGSVARQEDEQFFRDIFSSPPLLDTSLKQRTRILPILEEVWNKRRTEANFLWEDSLELIHDILLI
ncbi:hypothetical protein V493_04253 [Pseudogymnoascus sp. VKM F-4281 (FW-2241)]|nr:hypothetical protein V493_04253 [Pseudogymnoascus sp. VKM F-4281 (FW-2241)]